MMPSWYNWAVYLSTKYHEHRHAWAYDHNVLRATAKRYPDEYAVFCALERMKR